MASNNSLTASYEQLPKIAKLLIQFFLGYFVSAIYRIVRYLEKKNAVTLVVGILCFFGIGFIFWIIDFVTEILSDKIYVLAD